VSGLRFKARQRFLLDIFQTGKYSGPASCVGGYLACFQSDRFGKSSAPSLNKHLREKIMQDLQTWQILILAIVGVLILGAIAYWATSRRRSRHLRDHFGPEYNRTIAETGNRRAAEAELARRENRIRNLEVRPLSGADKQRFQEQWGLCQAQFVDDPAGAVNSADALLTDVLRARGYAADNPHDRISDISAAYPRHATRYRFAGDLVSRHRRGQGSTEDLRKAFVHYRALFDEILGGQDEELKRAS